MSAPTLLQNAVYVPEKDAYLCSKSPDDIQVITLDDGLKLAIRGGLDYAQRGGDHIALEEQNRYTEWTLTTEDAASRIASECLAIDPAAPALGYRPVCYMTDEQLETLVAMSPPGEQTLEAKVASNWLSTDRLLGFATSSQPQLPLFAPAATP